MTRQQSCIRGLDTHTVEWFHEEKRRAQARLDRKDLTNDRFMILLLDRYSLEADD